VKPQQGFTLLELIIVLVISVLGFAALGTNISSGNQTTKLQATARDIASALRYAHGQALMTRIPGSVTISMDDNSYRISDRNKVYRFPGEIEVAVIVAEEEFSATGNGGEGGEGSIRFFSDGSSTGGRVVLKWGKQFRRVDVNWITGEVKISDTPA
jgi:general secretion pathway protein H